MPYRVVGAPAARRAIKKLPRAVQASIIDVLRELAADPRPSGCKHLSGSEGFYRVRSGHCRRDEQSILCARKDDVRHYLGGQPGFCTITTGPVSWRHA